jgi:hypothetical protein
VNLNKQESISKLISLLKGEEDRWPMLLLGAGASFRSGVPTASEAVKQIAKTVYSEKILKGARPPERVKPSEWEAWLRTLSWFQSEPALLADNFPTMVEHLLVPAEYRKRVLLDLMRPVNGISSGYQILADLVMRGLIHTVLTTNFDPCLPDVLRQRHPHIRHVYEINRGPNDFEEFDVLNRCQIVWLHGKAEQYSDKNAAGEVTSLNSGLMQCLRPLLRASPIVVIGYRGSEPSIMEGLFGQNDTGRLDFPNGIFWCVRGSEPLHPNVQSLANRIGSNFQLLTIDGFDEVMEAASKGLAGLDRYGHSHHRQPGAASLAFDERIVDGASVADLDMDLALATLRIYCDKLGRAPLTRDTLPLLMREQGLLISGEDGQDKISNAAILLFGLETQRFLPQAVVAVSEGGKKREVYGGNLISQHKALLEKIDSKDVNPLLKLKKRRTHNDQPAYPPRVLTELLVNLLVHRDYQAAVSSTIEVNPGESITFRNSGGLTTAMAQQYVIEGDGRIVISNSITDQRNPSLCDVFFGISAMERSGTGLVDVNKLMLDSSGESAFFNNLAESAFTAIVKQPQTSAGSGIVALANMPSGLYVLNALPFSATPEYVSIVRLTTRLKNRPNGVRLEDCGTFIERAWDDGVELWSFAPLPILIELLGPIVDHDSCESKRTSAIEANPDERRVLSWLLRKHLEYHLTGFEDEGFILEGGRRHRAYFIGDEGKDREVIWDSALRKGNRRDVVKQRGTDPRIWFENEGIGYEIVRMGDIWCARIKPFYMFTGPDSVTPLASWARTQKATRRIKFDRNKNVETDLAFWSRFLGEGKETINIGDLHVGDLLLDTTFLTLEVADIKEVA